MPSSVGGRRLRRIDERRVPRPRADQEEEPRREPRHGFEVDLVGARAGNLVLASVKLFFGSAGVQVSSLSDSASDKEKKRCRIFHDQHVRAKIVEGACATYGYNPEAVELRLYVGKFKPGGELAVRTALSVLVPPPERSMVVGPKEILSAIQTVTAKGMYVDDPVIAAFRLQDIVRKSPS